MLPAEDAPSYRIWGVDNVVYGPVDLPMLVDWVREERVVAATWIHVLPDDRWTRAGDLSELRMFFHGNATGGRSATAAKRVGGIQIKPSSLRRVKVLALLSDEQLEAFVELTEVVEVRQWEEITREGSPGDAMFLLLEGEVRVRLMIAGRESILTTLQAGEFFGEVALFDHGPRSADVVANSNCVLLRIGAGSFQRMVDDQPQLAAPFLLAMGRSLIARIRADNKRYRDSIVFSRTSTPAALALGSHGA